MSPIHFFISLSRLSISVLAISPACWEPVRILFNSSRFLQSGPAAFDTFSNILLSGAGSDLAVFLASALPTSRTECNVLD